MSDEWLWRDDESGLALRPLADEAADEAEESDGTESLVELWLDETVVATLDADRAENLAKALADWARPTSVPVEGELWFQVYYLPEYEHDGELLYPEGLGEPNANGAFVFDEVDLVGVRARARALGEALAALHELRTGEAYHEDVAEDGRAWLSVFRMPADVRTWKGFWDDLEAVDDEELAGH